MGYVRNFSSIITASEPAKSWLHPFGMIDERGRAVGAKVMTYGVVFSAKEGDAQSLFYDEAPGKAWLVHVSPTRDGTDYGPYKRPKYVRSEAERDAEIERRLSDMRKRYAAKGYASA